MKSQFINRTSISIAAATVVTLVVLLIAGGLTRGVLNQFTSLLLLMTLGIAWNFVGGFGGQFSLGHSIFVGVGAYGTAIILTYFNLPLILTVLIAGAVSACIGILLAYPLLRLRGPYLAVGSLGIALAAYGWMLNWDFTRASSSFPIPPAVVPDIHSQFVWALVLAFVAILSVIILVPSPLGRRLVALRDDESGAAALGVRRIRTLIPIWALSGFLTGLMGALYGVQQGTLTVDALFAVQFSLDAAIVCVIGGLGTITGPIIGSIIVYYLRFYSATFSDWALLIEAIVVILVVRFFPGGIVGLVSKLFAAVFHRTSDAPPTVLTGAFRYLK